MQVSYKSR